MGLPRVSLRGEQSSFLSGGSVTAMNTSAAPRTEDLETCSAEVATQIDAELIAHTVTVYADVGDCNHSAVLADGAEAELRTGPEFDVDGVCDLVAPANAGVFGDELLVSIKFAELATFVHAVEARQAFGRDCHSAPTALTDSQLLYQLSGALVVYARDAHERIPGLIDEAHERAAMFLAYEAKLAGD